MKDGNERQFGSRTERSTDQHEELECLRLLDRRIGCEPTHFERVYTNDAASDPVRSRNSCGALVEFQQSA